MPGVSPRTCRAHRPARASARPDRARPATGAPLGQLVKNEIELVTQRALQDSLIQAKRMSIELLIPMALTVLPAFLILTIVPMLIGFGL